MIIEAQKEGMIKGKTDWEVLLQLRKLVKVSSRDMKEHCTEAQKWKGL